MQKSNMESETMQLEYYINVKELMENDRPNQGRFKENNNKGMLSKVQHLFQRINNAFK